MRVLIDSGTCPLPNKSSTKLVLFSCDFLRTLSTMREHRSQAVDSAICWELYTFWGVGAFSSKGGRNARRACIRAASTGLSFGGGWIDKCVDE